MQLPGTVNCKPTLCAQAAGTAVSNGAGLGAIPCKMRKNASCLVSTPKIADEAAPLAIVPGSCSWIPMMLPKLAQVMRFATARNSSKFVTGNVYLQARTGGDCSVRRRTSETTAT